MSFVQLLLRRGTAAEWTSANPVLGNGELGIETDTTQIKIGDGSTAWNALAYTANVVGPAGPAGPAGPTGPAGPAGDDGATGAQGPQGDQGPAGPAGPTGPAGADGADGATGAQGLQGDPGADGAAGPAGADGAPGSVWFSGSGAPSSGLGVDGDFYLDTATGDVYARSGGAWALNTNIEGPTGPAGADGAAGATGPQGPAGDPGADGATGPQGPEGPAGPAGANGQGVPTGGTAGQVLTKVDGTDFNTAWQTSTGGGSGGGQSMIWAEENGNLSSTTTDGYQWSWGNGGTGDGNELVVGFDCTIVALTLNTEASTTGTVAIEVNGTQQGTVSMTSSTSATSTVSIAVSAGDRLQFRTTAGSGGAGCVAGAVLQTAGVVGPAGPAGSDGATGPQGPEGPAGPAGADSTVPGPQGPQGIQGIQGDPGPTGPAGADSTVPGPEGPAGATGATGATGPAGADGLGWNGGSYDAGTGIVTFTSDDALGFATGDLRGAAGATGPAGPKGDNGDTGATGPAGPEGPAGPTGPAGADGSDALALAGNNQELTADRTISNGSNNFSLLVNLTDGANIAQILAQPTTPRVIVQANDGTNLCAYTVGSTNINLQFTGAADLQINGNPGTSGQVLTSNGIDAAPSWQTAAGGGSSAPIWMKRTGTGTQALTNTPATLGLSTELNAVNTTGEITYASNAFTAVTGGSYEIGAYLTCSSGAQRAQFACEVFVNGIATGDQRGQAYIRNSGSSYDFWALEMAPEPYELSAGDTIEVRIARTSGGSYGYSGSVGITFQRQYSRVWVRKIG